MQISKWTAEELFNLFLVVKKKFVLVTFNDMNIYWKIVKYHIFPIGRTSRHYIIKNDFLFTSTFLGSAFSLIVLLVVVTHLERMMVE